AEWVICFLHDMNRSISDFGVYFARRISGCDQTIIRRGHEQTRRKLRPALMVVGGAAAKIWFESEQICLRAIGGPRFLVQAAFDLVRLLVVLMGQHIVSRRSGQCVEGEKLEAIA